MAGKKQSVLPGFDNIPVPQVSLLPARERKEPAVWVAKIAVYREWRPSKETLLRQVIELRRGLNILRAQPTGATGEAARLAGHGAGKTTFCRLIRYVLGEDPAGGKGFRDAFRHRYEDGWVLAEVYVDGQRWLVGRPLSESGYHPFAKLGGSLEDSFPDSPSRHGFGDYQAAIDAAVFGKMKFRTLADSQRSLDWQRLLPWVSRDQEAHWSGLLEWRHTDSDSQSPFVSAEDKSNLVRLMLGLVDEEEQDLLAKFARKAKAHEEKVRDRPKLEYAINRQRTLLEEVLRIKVEGPEAPLLQQTVDNKVAALRKQADQAVAAVRQNEEIDKLVGDVSALEAQWGLANAFCEEYQELVDLEEARLTGKQPPEKQPQQQDPYRQFLKGMGPFPGYCSHPMDSAWRANCPIAQERSKDDEITEAAAEISDEAKSQNARLLRTKAELARRRRLAAPKKEALDQARNGLDLVRARQQAELLSLKAPAQEAARIEALLASYRQACAELEDWDKELVELRSQKDTLDAQLIALTTHHKKLLDQFTAIYNHLAHHLLGGAVTGTIRFSGKSIVPELEYHGPRDSAALKVVRWLIFDLAAMALGITKSAAHHPRFLMHDSPRESDLVPAIYVSLFHAAAELESASGEAPAFQYIVTTTEPPPQALNKAPWVLDPILDASRPEGRLLGVDL